MMIGIIRIHFAIIRGVPRTAKIVHGAPLDPLVNTNIRYSWNDLQKNAIFDPLLNITNYSKQYKYIVSMKEDSLINSVCRHHYSFRPSTNISGTP